MAAVHIFVSLFLAAQYPAGNDGASWTSDLVEGQTLPLCSGESLTLPWAVLLSSGETVRQVEWLYKGRSEEIVALLSHGHFSETAGFSGRVQQVGNAGISLSHVTSGDAGNYTVEVTVQEPSQASTTLRQSVVVNVKDVSSTVDGQLHVYPPSQPFFDAQINAWVVVLACGNFSHVTLPEFTVEWIDPQGNRLLSSGFRAGQSLLRLQRAQLSGGTYICEVRSACYQGPRTASYVLDPVGARLSMLEAENTQLRNKVQSLEAAGSFHDTIDALHANLITSLQNNLTALNSRMIDFQRQTDELKRRQVVFRARLDHYLAPVDWTKLVFGRSDLNLGSAYDNRTGVFTAPYHGYYLLGLNVWCLQAGASSIARIHISCAESHYCVDGWLCKAAGGNGVSSSCLQTVELGAGDQAWVETFDDGVADCFQQDDTSFLGFLISSL